MKPEREWITEQFGDITVNYLPIPNVDTPPPPGPAIEFAGVLILDFSKPGESIFISAHREES